jgi:hypothetical protein
MIARELDARMFVSRGFYQVFMKLVDRAVILGSLSMWLLRVNKTKKARSRVGRLHCFDWLGKTQSD